MSKQSDLDVNLYFEYKVAYLRNELIDLGTFNYNIKAIGRNLTENFEVFESYKVNRMYINANSIRPNSEILNNIKKVTSFELDERNTNPAIKKKIDKLNDNSDKILNLRNIL